MWENENNMRNGYLFLALLCCKILENYSVCAAPFLSFTTSTKSGVQAVLSKKVKFKIKK